MITVELKNLKFTIGSLKINGDDNFSVELNDFSYEVEASKEEIEMAEISSLVSKVISEVNGNNDLSEKVDKILHKVYATDAETDIIHRNITENTTDLKHIKSVVDGIQASSWVKK